MNSDPTPTRAGLRPARTTSTTLAISLAVALAVPTLAAAASSSASAPLRDVTATTASPDDLEPSEFGVLQYDGSPNCGNDVEVAYVADRVIVQTVRPNRARRAIDGWLTVNPPPVAPQGSGAAALRYASSTSLRAELVDSIHLRRPDGGDGLEPIAPVHAFDLPGDGPYDVLGLARTLREQLGEPVSPDYVARPHPHEFYMPDGIPLPAADLPVLREPFVLGGPDPGAGVRIAVFDTGLADSSQPQLLPNVSTYVPGDIERADADGDDKADYPFAGHGLSVTSTISVLVPGAEVTNARTMRRGLSTEFTSAKRIVGVLDALPIAERPHILVASFGTMACDRVPGVVGDELMPVALHAAADWVTQLSSVQPGEMALVAAAGNHGTQRREYPAAFGSVISVGALDTTLDADGDALTSPTGTGRIADYSGSGSWVDAYAPGTGILTLHVEGPRGVDFGPWADPLDPPAETVVDGAAYVNGTSYATPNLAATMAELMASDGRTVWEAWAQLQSLGARPQPACDGSLPGNPASVAVVLVDRAAPIGTPGVAGPPPAC